MTDFLKYLRIRILKAIKLYPVIICFTLILALGVGIFFGNLISNRSESESNTKFQIGLVGDTSDSYLGIGVFAVTNFDVSKDYSEFIEMSEDEAKKRLEENSIIGYIKIPDGFIDSVVRGDNIDIKYITNTKPALLGTLLVEEICSVVSDLVISSQNGIYGFSEYAKGLTYAERSKLIDRINIEYIACVFDRNSGYEINELGYADNLSFEIYYISAFLIILMMLWGMCCTSLLVKDNYSLSRSLIFSGRGIISQILAEFIPFFLVIFSFILIILFAVGICIEYEILDVGFLPTLDSLGGCIELGFIAIPTVFTICSLQFLLYEISGGIISAVVLQVLSTVALSYVSGFIFPVYSLPSLLQDISRYLPTAIGFDYVSSLLCGTFKLNTFTVLLAYTMVMLIAAAVVRYYRVRSDRYA